MTEPAPLMMRYLLGELSEGERDEFEARYFEDPRLFAQLADVESALVDDYVRGELTAEVTRQFEAHYLADPSRRERVRFAEALVARVDRGDTATQPLLPAQKTAAAWRGWLAAIRGPRLAASLATVVLAGIGIWLFVDARRSTQETATTAGDLRAPDDASVPPAVGTPSSTAPSRNATPPVATSPAPSVLAITTLALTVGPGERTAAAGEPPSFTIPPGAEQVRLVLTLREHDYARYRVIVRAIGGDEVFRQSDLIPTVGAQRAFTLTAPAARFQSGDYLLTLQGRLTAGDYEDLSQTIFRVRN